MSGDEAKEEIEEHQVVQGVVEGYEAEGEEVNTELDKYWKAVRDNPGDFTGWTYLLQYVEQEKKLDQARKAYDAFFEHYPYCYGYWKKYADMEKKQSGAEKALEVFERGTKAISLSVELWLHYITFYTEEFGKLENGEEGIRGVFEKAINACGKDFRSDKLWDTYISWEENLIKKTALYDRILQIPTQLYSHHFENFKHHVLSHHPKEILTLDNFLQLRKEVVVGTSELNPEGEGVGDDGPPGEVGPPGEDAPPGMEIEGEKSDDDEAGKLRDRIISVREEIFKKTEDEVSKRWNFEEAIKRPYFHVKPLEKSQLKNWKDYLDFEIEAGDHERVVILFERCMIATALYEDFWLKYAKYMEDHSVEAVRLVYMRACRIHLPKKPYISLAWAAFEERHGNYDLASQILSELDKNVPGLVMVNMRKISLERRKGNTAMAETLFQEYINGASQPEISSFFSIKFARYLLKIIGDTERARATLQSAVEKDRGNIKLYLQLLDLEYQCRPISEENVIKIFASILDCENFPLETKAKMSQRKLEFLEDFCASITTLKESYDEHQKLMKDLHNERKKRPSDAVSSEEPAEKRPKVEATQNGSGDQSQMTGAVDPYYGHWGSYANSGYSYPPQQWGYGQHYYPS